MCFRRSKAVRKKSIADARNSRILEQDFLKKEKPPNRVLLLGTGKFFLDSGGCGKSTISKQMTILYGKGFSTAQREVYGGSVLTNINDGIISLLSGMQQLSLVITCQETLDAIKLFQEVSASKDSVALLKVIQSDEVVKAGLARSNEFQLNFPLE